MACDLIAGYKDLDPSENLTIVTRKIVPLKVITTNLLKKYPSSVRPPFCCTI